MYFILYWGKHLENFNEFYYFQRNASVVVDSMTWDVEAAVVQMTGALAARCVPTAKEVSTHQ